MNRKARKLLKYWADVPRRRVVLEREVESLRASMRYTSERIRRLEGQIPSAVACCQSCWVDACLPELNEARAKMDRQEAELKRLQEKLVVLSKPAVRVGANMSDVELESDVGQLATFLLNRADGHPAQMPEMATSAGKALAGAVDSLMRRIMHQERDVFAATALQALVGKMPLVSKLDGSSESGVLNQRLSVAVSAYGYADAMLVARNLPSSIDAVLAAVQARGDGGPQRAD